MNESVLTQVAESLRDARSVLFITGAGISADSGLPTYRGVGGLYDGNDTEEGVTIEEALSGPMLDARPELTWKYLWQIGAACRGAQPNAAHEVIAEIAAEKEDVWVVTQNVDGLHRAAGPQNLIEVHGNIEDLACTECGDAETAADLLARCSDPPQLPPLCGNCNGILRPEVVLFGEFLTPQVINALNDLARRSFDITFAIGTTAVFPYIRAPILRAQQQGKTTVEINPTDTSLSHQVEHYLRMGAAETMQRIWTRT